MNEDILNQFGDNHEFINEFSTKITDICNEYSQKLSAQTISLQLIAMSTVLILKLAPNREEALNHIQKCINHTIQFYQELEQE